MPGLSFNLNGQNGGGMGSWGQPAPGALSYGLPAAPAPAPFVPMSFGSSSGGSSGGGFSGGGVSAPSMNFSAADVGGASVASSGIDPAAVDAGAGGGWFSNTFMNEGGGLNLDSISTIGKTLGAFGQVYAGIQANKIAKDSLNFQKQSYATNLKNQLSSYNLALEDRVSARYKQEGRSGEAEGYINKHKL